MVKGDGDDDDDLVRRITSDPVLSEASKRHYASKLGSVRRFTGHGLAWVMSHPDETMAVLEERLSDGGQKDLHAQSLRAYCSSVLALLERVPPSTLKKLKVSPVARTRWSRCTLDTSQIIHKQYANHIASDRQRDNFVRWEDLLDKRDELDAEDSPLHGTNAHLLLSMLTHMPPMRTSDLGSLRLHHVARDAQLPKTEARLRSLGYTTGNHLVLGPRRAVVAISDYKTARVYADIEAKKKEKKKENKNDANAIAIPATVTTTDGDDGPLENMSFVESRKLDELEKRKASKTSNQSVTSDDLSNRTRFGEIPADLHAAIRANLGRTYPQREWLFVDARGRPFALENSFNQMALRELRGLFDGRALTVNLVRHAAAVWLDREHRDNRPMLRYFQYWMMHSRGMQRKYVLSNDIVIGDGGGGRMHSGHSRHSGHVPPGCRLVCDE